MIEINSEFKVMIKGNDKDIEQFKATLENYCDKIKWTQQDDCCEGTGVYDGLIRVGIIDKLDLSQYKADVEIYSKNLALISQEHIIVKNGKLDIAELIDYEEYNKADFLALEEEDREEFADDLGVELDEVLDIIKEQGVVTLGGYDEWKCTI